jgi:hypothetical protein
MPFGSGLYVLGVVELIKISKQAKGWIYLGRWTVSSLVDQTQGQYKKDSTVEIACNN